MSSIEYEKPKKGMFVMNSTTLENEEKLVKHSLEVSMREHNIKQEIVAQVIKVNQSTISRLKDPEEKLNLSVADLSMMHSDKFTSAIADDIIAAIGGRFNLQNVKTNGDVIDELIELTKLDGRLAVIVEDGVQANEHGKILRLADMLIDLGERLKAEVQLRKK